MDRHLVRHIRRADRTEQDGIVLGERLPSIDWQDAAILAVEFRSPWQMVEFKSVTRIMLRHDFFKHADGLIDHFRPDAIATDHGDLVNCHPASPSEVTQFPGSNCPVPLGQP